MVVNSTRSVPCCSILQQGTDLLKGKTARKKTMEEDHASLTLKRKKKAWEKTWEEDHPFLPLGSKRHGTID
jgi:hypothetical protein